MTGYEKKLTSVFTAVRLPA